MKENRFDINGKCVLITGGSSGIGLAVANAFALKGAKLVLVGRDQVRLNAALRNLQQESPESFSLCLDITADDAVANICEKIRHKTGWDIDVLVNAAGKGVLGRVEDVPIEALKDSLDLNFFAPVALIKAVLPGMKKRGYGQIINITSGVALRGMPGISPYCSSKAALLRLSESLRVELKPYNIDVIDFSPGLVTSNFEKNLIVFGQLNDTFTDGRATTTSVVAERILRASRRRERYVSMSLRARLVEILDMFFPTLIDNLLERRSRVK